MNNCLKFERVKVEMLTEVQVKRDNLVEIKIPNFRSVSRMKKLTEIFLRNPNLNEITRESAMTNNSVQEIAAVKQIYNQECVLLYKSLI
jgi:hypothetical protein